jgi:hypothetical protein
MLQFRLTEKVRKLFNFDDEHFSEPVNGDAFLGNWYLDIVELSGRSSLLFMAEKTALSFVLLDVRSDHADTMANGFINGLDHLLREEQFAKRSIRRIFEGIDIMEIAIPTNEGALARLQHRAGMYRQRVDAANGLDNCNILDVMKAINREADGDNGHHSGTGELSPIKATKCLLRNSDIHLH